MEGFPPWLQNAWNNNTTLYRGNARGWEEVFLRGGESFRKKAPLPAPLPSKPACCCTFMRFFRRAKTSRTAARFRVHLGMGLGGGKSKRLPLRVRKGSILADAPFCIFILRPWFPLRFRSGPPRSLPPPLRLWRRRRPCSLPQRASGARPACCGRERRCRSRAYG